MLVARPKPWRTTTRDDTGAKVSKTTRSRCVASAHWGGSNSSARSASRIFILSLATSSRSAQCGVSQLKLGHHNELQTSTSIKDQMVIFNSLVVTMCIISPGKQQTRSSIGQRNTDHQKQFTTSLPPLRPKSSAFFGLLRARAPEVCMTCVPWIGKFALGVPGWRWQGPCSVSSLANTMAKQPGAMRAVMFEDVPSLAHRLMEHDGTAWNREGWPCKSKHLCSYGQRPTVLLLKHYPSVGTRGKLQETWFLLTINYIQLYARVFLCVLEYFGRSSLDLPSHTGRKSCRNDSVPPSTWLLVLMAAMKFVDGTLSAKRRCHVLLRWAGDK